MRSGELRRADSYWTAPSSMTTTCESVPVLDALIAVTFDISRPFFFASTVARVSDDSWAPVVRFLFVVISARIFRVIPLTTLRGSAKPADNKTAMSTPSQIPQPGTRELAGG